MAKILLSGATGLVGSAMLTKLSEAHDVLALTREPIEQRHLVCDLASLDAVAAEIKNFAPDITIHAGWMGSDSEKRNDAELLEANIKSSMKLLSIAADSGCKRWITFGSQAEYSPLETPIAENSPTLPESAYGTTKLALCNREQLYCEQHGIEFIWLRLFSCYGSKQKPPYLIPHLLNAMKKGNVPEIKTPHAVWDFMHTDDAADAVARIIAAPGKGGIYNLASGKGTSVGKVALIIAEQLHFPYTSALMEQVQTHEKPPTHRIADITKFSNAFDWQPRLSIEEGLAKCLAN